ncbi:hypothetical protein [Clostridium tertium]|uniref:hypothetical protein n=1 Tax=Clostridium tertium TaxID=1559 RepID=UPI0023B3507A|nr:hypothetical protein [Clostridium tertium]
MLVKNISEIKKYKKLLIIGDEDSGVVQYVMNPIKKSYDHKIHNYIKDNRDFKDAIERVKYKPFFNEKWFLIYNNIENRAPVKSQLEKLFVSTNKNYDCIAYISYRTYKYALTKEKWLKNNDIGVVNLTYMPIDFYKALIFSNLKVSINNDALNLFLKYISNDFQNIINYIGHLNTINRTITVNDIKCLIEDTRILGIDDYMKSILEHKHKKAVKVISELISRYKFKTLKENIEKDLSIMISIKNLMYKGLILPYTYYEDIKSLKDHGKLPDNLSKVSYKKIKTYTDLVLKVQVKELVLIQYILLAARDDTHLIILTMLLTNRENWDKDDVLYIKDILEGR